MKTVQWILIGCRVVAICFGLMLLGSGCGDLGGVSTGGSPSEEEAKRDQETRKAMEAASHTAKKR
jgi:hypothetical protein